MWYDVNMNTPNDTETDREKALREFEEHYPIVAHNSSTEYTVRVCMLDAWMASRGLKA